MDPKSPLIHLFRKPTVENVAIVEEYIHKNIKTICARNQDKLIITAIFTLIAEMPDIRNKNEVITRLVKLAIILITNSSVTTVMSMQTMLVILLKMIGVSPAYMSIQPNLSEELKLAIVNCFDVTFRKATKQVIQEFFTKDNLNILAQVLSVNENIVSKESYRALRIAAVKCIMSIFQVHNECDDENTDQRKHIADITFLLIPKIMSTLMNVATSGSIVGDHLIAISITAIHRILFLIFEDYESKSGTIPKFTDLLNKSIISTDAGTLVKNAHTVDDRLNALKSKERNDEWLAIASSKLCSIFQRLKMLCNSNSNQIRKELFKLSDLLLCRCQRNMVSCIPALLEINICLNNENQPHNSAYTENVVDVAEELFATHLVNLPRIIYTGDEDEQMVGFLELQGLVRLLYESNRLKITLSNDDIMEKFIAVLLSAVEMDRDNKLLETNSHMYDINEMSDLNQSTDITPWKNYTNLRNPKILQIVRHTCQCVSKQNQAYTFILEFLFKLLAKNTVSCNEALVLIQIFLDSSENEFESTDSLHMSILENLLNDYRWQLETHADEHSHNSDRESDGIWFEDRVDGLYESAVSVRWSDIRPNNLQQLSNAITLKEVKNNILHICLVIETIGCYARKKKRQYEVCLLKSLPNMIEKSSSAHYFIRVSAVLTLDIFKKAFELNSTSDLIFTNVDYVTQSINTSLKKPHRLNDALRILNTASYYRSIQSIPHLEGVVLNIIAESTKINQSKNMLAFMHAFKCILSNIREYDTKSTNELSSVEPMNCITNLKRNHFDEWIEILQAIPCIDDEHIDDDTEIDPSEQNQNDDMDIEEHKPNIPSYIQLTVNIIKHCIPHIASNDINVKLMAFECLIIGLDLIKDHESELLPIVHLTWDPFMQQCIRNQNPVVLRYCFQFVKQVAIHAKEFINQRSTKQLLPNITKYLIVVSKKYITDKQSSAFYEHCQEIKTLKEILVGLPVILKSINVQEKDLNDVLDAIPWTFKKKKPPAMRHICENFIRELESFDICAVYVKLLEYN